MSATPTYDAVVEELKIDPELIAARPAWSFEIAERVRKHRKRMQRSAAAKARLSQSAAEEVATRPVRAKRASTAKGAATTQQALPKKTVPAQARRAKQPATKGGAAKRPAAAK